MSDFDKVLARANELYEGLKGYVWDGFKAPEQRPQIQSDQIKAMGQAIHEELNELRTQLAKQKELVKKAREQIMLGQHTDARLTLEQL